MKTIRELKTLHWCGYFFKEMVHILDIDPEYFIINCFKGIRDGSAVFNLYYCEENCVLHIVFNNIECIFRKSGIYSYLIFCENDKNKKMLDNYVSIIDQIKEAVLSFEYGDDLFIMDSDFTRFRFKTDGDLIYNKKINIPVCVISLSSIIKKGNIYCPQFKLQKCFYESDFISKNL